MLDIFNNLSSGLGGTVNVVFGAVWELFNDIVSIISL